MLECQAQLQAFLLACPMWRPLPSGDCPILTTIFSLLRLIWPETQGAVPLLCAASESHSSKLTWHFSLLPPSII